MMRRFMLTCAFVLVFAGMAAVAGAAEVQVSDPKIEWLHSDDTYSQLLWTADLDNRDVNVKRVRLKINFQDNQGLVIDSVEEVIYLQDMGHRTISGTATLPCNADRIQQSNVEIVSETAIRR